MSDPLPEEEPLDLIQNIELTIHYVYQKTPSLTDYQVLTALEALQKDYKKGSLDQKPHGPRNVNALVVYTALRAICELRLGRSADLLTSIETPGDFEIIPVSAADLLSSLKRLRKLVEGANKKGGPQGYLNTLSQVSQ